MTHIPYPDRRSAGQLLAEQLHQLRGLPELQILALPRGGVPVAFEIARALHAPLDVFVVRKLGVPDHPEMALGAIASGGVCVLNSDVLKESALDSAVIEQVIARERDELERRERLYRGERAAHDVRGRPILLVDDGLATGASMRAAVAALRAQSPASIFVAVPVGSQSACAQLLQEVEAVICPRTPEPFFAVGLSYDRFNPVSDEAVRELLQELEQIAEHSSSPLDSEIYGKGSR